MDYKTGAHVIVAKKSFTCEHCKQEIQSKDTYLMRRIVIIPGKQNDDKRYHFACALGLPDLTDEERKMITNKSKIDNEQTLLGNAINNLLTRYEYLGSLVFIRYNVKGLMSFIVFPKDSKVFVVSLASKDNKTTPTWLEKKLSFISKFRNDVCYVTSIEGFEPNLQKYINKN